MAAFDREADTLQEPPLRQPGEDRLQLYDVRSLLRAVAERTVLLRTQAVGGRPVKSVACHASLVASHRLGGCSKSKWSESPVRPTHSPLSAGQGTKQSIITVVGQRPGGVL